MYSNKWIDEAVISHFLFHDVIVHRFFFLLQRLTKTGKQQKERKTKGELSS